MSHQKLSSECSSVLHRRQFIIQPPLSTKLSSIIGNTFIFIYTRNVDFQWTFLNYPFQMATSTIRHLLYDSSQYLSNAQLNIFQTVIKTFEESSEICFMEKRSNWPSVDQGIVISLGSRTNRAGQISLPFRRRVLPIP